MGLQKHIDRGMPRGRRDMLRISGTGCICSDLSYREAQVNGRPMSFLNIRVVSNSVRVNEDGGADQYSEFTDLLIAGNRAKALANILEKGQIVEFAGRLRSKAFDSDRYFKKADDGTADTTSPAVFQRIECSIGQDGWINIMKGANEETRKKNEEAKAAITGMTGSGTTAIPTDMAGLREMFSTLLKECMPAAATPATAQTQTQSESPLDLGAEAEVLTDDDIPF